MAINFKSKISETTPYRLVTVRPVELKQQRQLQFSYFTQRQNIVKNYRLEEFQPALEELLAMPFSSMQLQTLNEDVTYQVGAAAAHAAARRNNSCATVTYAA